MPYIALANRKRIDSILFEKLDDLKEMTKGELEYCIYKLMIHYMKSKTFNYSNLHDCTYAAIHCGDEFRRNHLDKREDVARTSNGDIV